MADDQPASIAGTVVPVGKTTQFIAKHLLTQLAIKTKSRAKTVQRLVGALPPEAQLEFGVALVDNLREVAGHLLGPDLLKRVAASGGLATGRTAEADDDDTEADEPRLDKSIIKVDASSSVEQRSSLISWINYASPAVEESRRRHEGETLDPDDVVLAIQALDMGELRPLLTPYKLGEDPGMREYLNAKGVGVQAKRGRPINAYDIAETQCVALAYGNGLIASGANKSLIQGAIVRQFGARNWDTVRKWKSSFDKLLGKEYYEIHYQTLTDDDPSKLEWWCTAFVMLILPRLAHRYKIASGRPQRVTYEAQLERAIAYMTREK